MSYDLRREKWLPVRYDDGTTDWIILAAIAPRPKGKKIVGLSCPRPDFDGAVSEFLIGLLTTAFSVEDEAAWRELWNNPPTSKEFQARLDALPDAFDLDRPGPRFFQDLAETELAKEELEPAQELLLTAKNSSLFVKPGTIRTLGRPAAAMALITAQSYSTAAGRGYRTSMRGGGPLTTLVDPRRLDQPEVSLWHFLWANVETLEDLDKRSAGGGSDNDPVAIFPWLAPTRTSEKGTATLPPDANPLQAYFGMPRRVRLEFSDTAGICDITGLADTRMVVGFRGRPSGVNYEGWQHPLSPYYEGKAVNERLPMHAQPGGVGWRDWASLMHQSEGSTRFPAQAVRNFPRNRAGRIGLTRHMVRIFGYDATNAKVREWVSSSMPTIAPTDPSVLDTAVATAAALTEATNIAGFLVQSAVAASLHDRPDTVSGVISRAKQDLWRATESWFFEAMERFAVPGNAVETREAVQAEYQTALSSRALQVFDALAPDDSSRPEVVRRVVLARANLANALAGRGGMGEKLFTELGLVSASEKKRRSAKSTASDTTEAA